jgi:hypothetical protein
MILDFCAKISLGFGKRFNKLCIDVIGQCLVWGGETVDGGTKFKDQFTLATNLAF